MSDQGLTSHVPFRMSRPRRAPKAEYATYFLLILALALPVQMLVWTATLIRRGRLPEIGPVGRARRDAETITPAIFRP